MGTYDPKKVICNVGNAIIQGFGPGTFVEVERNGDAVSLLVGTQGEYAWAINRDKSGIITLQIMQTAQSNDILWAMAIADEQAGAGSRPFSLEDLNGRTLVQSAEVKVMKLPNLPYSNEVSPREWKLVAGSLDVMIGGNLLP